MPRSSFDHMDCSVAQTLEVIGEWWTLLILRNAFHGMRTFDAFQQQLDISSSVLSSRLKKLTDAGILEKQQSSTDGRYFEYRLTESGFDIYPIIVSLMEWGEKWNPSPQGRRINLIEKATGKPVKGVAVLSAKGKPLHAREVVAVAGPGADSQAEELVGYHS